MRSTLGSMKSTNMHSSIGGISSMSAIRVSNNTISQASKFNLVQQIANFDKFLGGNPLTQKDLADIKKLGYTYRKYQNGDLYYGQGDERPQGQGLYVFSSFSSDKKPYFYKGGFQNGEYHGFGKLCKMINDRQAVYCYQGNWKNGKREGEGVQSYNADSSMHYKGSWLNDQRHGHGTLKMPDGIFQGMWLNGKMNGEGTLTMIRGPFKNLITGQWFDDDISEGIIKYSSSSTNREIGQYRGGIRNLMRDGKGTYRSGNIQLSGVFSKDQLTDYTQLKNATNEAQYVIKGNYTRPQLVGLEADITYSNKDRYQGLVDITPDHIVRRTKGKYYYKNGEIAEGQFEDNYRGELIIKR